MTFAHWWVLGFLVVPLVLLWWWRGGRPRARTAFPLDHFAHAKDRFLRFVLVAAFALPALILAGVIVLLAGPQTMQSPGRTRPVKNIQIMLDVSFSMEEESPSRYSIARQAIEEFTKAREGDEMGLMLFGSEQIRLVPLTRDLQAIRSTLPFADPALQPEHMQGTRIADALRFAAKTVPLEAKGGDRIVILVSDGESNDDLDKSVQQVTEILQDARITMFFLHVGSASSARAAFEIAPMTGGRAFVARDRGEILHVFRRIDSMTRSDPVVLAPCLMDDFRVVSVVLLVLCGLSTLSMLGLRYTPW